MRSSPAAVALLLAAVSPAAPASAGRALEACVLPKLETDARPIRPARVYPVTLAPGTTLRAGPREGAPAAGRTSDGRQSWLVVDLCGPWALVAKVEGMAGYVPIRLLRPNGRPFRSLPELFPTMSGPAAPQVWRLHAARQ